VFLLFVGLPQPTHPCGEPARIAGHLHHCCCIFAGFCPRRSSNWPVLCPSLASPRHQEQALTFKSMCHDDILGCLHLFAVGICVLQSHCDVACIVGLGFFNNDSNAVWAFVLLQLPSRIAQRSEGGKDCNLHLWLGCISRDKLRKCSSISSVSVILWGSSIGRKSKCWCPSSVCSASRVLVHCRKGV